MKDEGTNQRLEREAIEAEHELQADIRASRIAIRERAAERCTVCFNPGAVNADGYCSNCIASVSSVETVPTVSELMADPCTPFWVSELIPVLLRKDACDVAGALELLSAVFSKRADDLLKSGR